MTIVKRLDELGRRMPEQGRIRLGEKTGSAMRSLDHFRFTSVDRQAIEQIAALYGGTPKPWSDPKASVQGQYEVKTTSAEISVLIPQGGLSTWYEEWSGGGCVKRCDGETCTMYSPNEHTVPCVCESKGKMTCRPYSRLNVILPDVVPFGGTWRMETKGWNAAHELGAMESMIFGLQEATAVPLRAKLILERRTKTKGGKKQNFVVPRIAIDGSVQQLVSGEATAIRPAVIAPPMAALPAGDDEVVDAEIEEDDVKPSEWAEKIQAKYVPTGNTVMEKLHDQAAELLRRWPAFGRSDDECLDAMAGLVSKGVHRKVDDLDDAQRMRLLQACQDLLDGKAVPSFDGGTLRIRRA